MKSDDTPPEIEDESAPDQLEAQQDDAEAVASDTPEPADTTDDATDTTGTANDTDDVDAATDTGDDPDTNDFDDDEDDEAPLFGQAPEPERNTIWTADDDEGYAYVHRSSPGFDMSKWLVVGGVAAVFILLSFILIPKLFTRDETAAAASSSAPPTSPPATSAPPAVVSYRDTVIATGPTHYWDFAYGADPAADAMATSNLTLGKGVVPLGSSGVKSSSGAIDCSGASNSRINSQTPETPTGDFSIEAWINTATKQGGQIVSFGSDATGTSSQVDRTLYVDGYGNASIGARDGKRQVASSEALVNDGKWHHIVGTMSSTGGLTIYVDGVASGTEAKGTSAGEFEGYWRICGDSLSGWPRVAGNPAFVGSVDEVAVYNKALTADEVKAHFTAGQ